MTDDHIVAEIINARPIAAARVWFNADDGTWRPGKSAKALRRTGYTVIASDIEPHVEGIERNDFFTDEPPQNELIAATNLPFHQIDRFLARVRLACPHVFDEEPPS